MSMNVYDVKAHATIKKFVDKHRKWWYTEFGIQQQKSQFRGLDFTIMSYNVLAQKLLEDHPELYRNCNDTYLEWSYRSHNLLREIYQHDADILCLQEVEEKHYLDFFYPQLKQSGYTGIYKKKTQDKVDGCAIFFKGSKFSFLERVDVEYLKENIRVLNRDNIGLIVVLKPRDAALQGVKLCIANTHLLYNPRRGDVKLSQLRVLLAELERVSFKARIHSKPVYHPVLLCGDMNSQPFFPLYDFLVNGLIQYNIHSSPAISGQSKRAQGIPLTQEYLSLVDIGINCDTKYDRNVKQKSSSQNRGNVAWEDHASTSERRNDSGTFYQPFNFEATYNHVNDDGTSEVTSHNCETKSTVDYIMYNVNEKRIQGSGQTIEVFEGQLKHLGSYGLLHPNDFKDIKGLPNAFLSSDHLCLISRFLLTPT